MREKTVIYAVNVIIQKTAVIFNHPALFYICRGKGITKVKNVL